MDMASTSLVVTIASIVVGIIGIATSRRYRRHGGRKVRVSSTYSIPVYAGDEPFLDDDQITISVVNKGTAPVTVTAFGVRMGNSRNAGNMFVTRPHAMSDRLPAVAEPGGTPVSVAVPVSALRDAHEQRGIAFKHMQPWVELGDGRRVFSRNPAPRA